LDTARRDILKFTLAGLALPILRPLPVWAQLAGGDSTAGVFNVRAFGAAGDGKQVDTPAINRAIEAAASSGGGTVRVPAGQYLCYSIHLRSNVALYLEQGAAIIAADTPHEGTTSGGYDQAESNAPWEAYQDFGHNHWHNSLIWGEDLHDIAILGPGLIWGRGLSWGHDDPVLPRAEAPGVGNKAIALKNCHNVLLRDFSILQGGHFGILATGVDNFSIDNLRIDTNRDGIDIDCCRNVHVSNCTVNSPWDDGICPKSSFALGYARPTENVTISNCCVTGDYQLGTVLDGSFKRFGPDFDANVWQRTGRIKCGTESNGGFKNIAISNCVFESCRGLALETVDGGILEDITFTGVTMRDIRNAPLYLRLGGRMRGPQGVPIGRLARVLIENVTCYGPVNAMPSIIAGLPGHPVEDVKISDCFFLHKGGGTPEMAAIVPEEHPDDYPEPYRMGTLPAQHFYVRHARNVEFSNVELASASPDARPSFWMSDVQGADLFRLKLPRDLGGPAFQLDSVSDFRVAASRGVKDAEFGSVGQMRL
jgi:polygalacturonase